MIKDAITQQIGQVGDLGPPQAAGFQRERSHLDTEKNVRTNLGGRLVFINRIGGRVAPIVVEIAAVKASGNKSEPQLSIAWPQRIQSKAVILTRFQQTSINGKSWFGTMFSTLRNSSIINRLQIWHC